MSTVQKNIFKLALVVAKTTKNGFKYNDSTAAVTISTATNASPIVITTTTNHGYVTGQQVYISGVATNTAANNTASNPNWTITRTGATTFSLDGSTGNGAGTGGTATAELVGSVDAANVTRQRLLDIYNDARKALFQAARDSFNRKELAEKLYGVQVLKTDLTFASGVVTFPTGYLFTEYLTDVNGLHIAVLPLSDKERVIDLLSTTNRFVFEVTNQFKMYNWTSGILPNAATYILCYYGLTDFTLSDVLGASVSETINYDYEPILIQLAVAIFNGMSNADVLELATKLLRG